MAVFILSKAFRNCLVYVYGMREGRTDSKELFRIISMRGVIC